MSNEKRHLFDDPRNTRWLLRVLYTLCALLLGLDFVIQRHAEHPLESWWGFYGGYGFVACVVLVLVAKEMRKAVMRAEDYYNDGA